VVPQFNHLLHCVVAIILEHPTHRLAKRVRLERTAQALGRRNIRTRPSDLLCRGHDLLNNKYPFQSFSAVYMCSQLLWGFSCWATGTHIAVLDRRTVLYFRLPNRSHQLLLHSHHDDSSNSTSSPQKYLGSRRRWRFKPCSSVFHCVNTHGMVLELNGIIGSG
jgi:hypothetical protein